ncbi:MAG: endonuclease III [Eubacteriaceae bacterium]|nr:endonuclease III [Eubacteriaceae bacterium]
MLERSELDRITEKLIAAYPEARCALDHHSPFELLIATVLSAQCTDVRVNMVTPALFAAADTPKEMASLGYDRLYPLIKTCGLADSKTKHILKLSEKLVNEYSSEVPSTMEELTSLPGVGRKTANVVLANAFGVPTIAVDTHVFRVSNRIGYAEAKDVGRTEKQLMENIDRDKWILMHHVLITHGRRICHSRKPECGACPVRDECGWTQKS